MKKKFITKLTKLAITLAMVATLTACGEDEVVVAPEPVVAEDPIAEEPEVEEPIEEVGNGEEASSDDFMFEELEDGSGMKLTDYSGTATVVTVPDTHDGKPVVVIGDRSFMTNEAIEEVILPDSVITIGADAFFMCSDLDTITLPEALTYLGEGAFGNTAITEITIPSGIEELTLLLFANTKIEKIVIPGTVKTIDASVFHSCNQLREVEIQEGVESIGDMAFEIQSEVTISIPASVTFIDDFEFCEDNIDVIVVAGSYGEEYAKQWELNYTVK